MFMDASTSLRLQLRRSATFSTIGKSDRTFRSYGAEQNLVACDL